MCSSISVISVKTFTPEYLRRTFIVLLYLCETARVCTCICVRTISQLCLPPHQYSGVKRRQPLLLYMKNRSDCKLLDECSPLIEVLLRPDAAQYVHMFLNMSLLSSPSIPTNWVFQSSN